MNAKEKLRKAVFSRKANNGVLCLLFCATYALIPGIENCFAAEGDLLWAKRAGGTGRDEGQRVVALPDGGALVTGSFVGTATFGTGEPNQTVLTSVGGYDIYLAKYNPDGTLAWAKRAGGPAANPGDEAGYGVTSLADGSAQVTGYFRGAATFGPGEPNQTVLTAAGPYDIFIAKYNPDGRLVWAKRAGGEAADMCCDVKALPDGSALLTGNFAGTATFGPGEPNQTVLTALGAYDMFLAKYNPDGTLAWVKRAGSASGYRVVALSSGSVLVAGSILSPATALFGPGEPNQTILTSAGTYDIFLAKYNPDGTLAWVKRAGGAGDDLGYDMAALPDGCALITGFFSGNATFGSGGPNQTVLTSVSWYDMYVAKYNPDGTLAWAKRAGSSGWDGGYSIAAMSDGSALVCGMFGGTATFGPGEPNQTVLTSAGGLFDIFVAKYNPNGTLAWARRAGGASQDDCVSIAVLRDGNALVTGRFWGTATFGAGEPNQTSLTAAADYDIFLAKYSVVSLPPNHPPVAVCKNATAQLDSAGMVTIGPAAVDGGSYDPDPGDTITLSVSPSSFIAANLGANTVTLTVTDSKGATASCTAVVTVVDTTPPTITPPADVTVATDSGKAYATNVSLGSPTASDNSGVVTVNNNAPTSYPLGVTVATWTAVDNAGNSASCQQKVTVVDTEPPRITAPANVTVQTDAGKCEATGVNLAWNCGPWRDDALVLHYTFDGDTNSSVLDVSGNHNDGYRVGNVTYAAGVSGQAVRFTSRDTYIVSAAPGLNMNGWRQVTISTWVQLRNYTTYGQIISRGPLVDQSPGAFEMAAGQFYGKGHFGVYTNSSAAVVAYSYNPPRWGNPNLALNRWYHLVGTYDGTNVCYYIDGVLITSVVMPIPDTAIWDGPITKLVIGNMSRLPFINWYDMYLNGLVDEVRIYRRALSVAEVTELCHTGDLPGAADNCGSVSVTNNAPAVFPKGVTVVTWTATDTSGNRATSMQTVTVEDKEKPVIIPPADVTLAANENCQAALPALAAKVTDNCDAAPAITQSPAVGTLVGLGTIAVTLTATDAAGNAANCIANVTVVDTTPPTIACPQDVTVATDPGKAYATGVNLGNPTASDNSGVVTVNNNAPASYPLGMTMVTWTAIDKAGNSASCQQKVTVVDGEPPMIVSLEADPDTLWPPNTRMVDVTLGLAVTDNSGGPIASSIAGVTANQTLNAADFVITGNLSVQLRAARPPNGPARVYAVAVQCADQSGNKSSGAAQVMVPWERGDASKSNAVAVLKAVDAGENKDLAHRLEAAIVKIGDSLAAELWEQNGTLTSKGKKVFDREAEAARELMKIVTDDGKGYPDAAKCTALTAVYMLLTVDDDLALAAIKEAQAGQGDAKELQKAVEAYNLALAEIMSQDYDKAIEDYKKAWAYARLALKKAVEEDNAQPADPNKKEAPQRGTSRRR